MQSAARRLEADPMGTMTGKELRQALTDLHLTQKQFARLIEVTERCVSLWTTETRKVPGSVRAYLELAIEKKNRSAEQTPEKTLAEFIEFANSVLGPIGTPRDIEPGGITLPWRMKPRTVKRLASFDHTSTDARLWAQMFADIFTEVPGAAADAGYR